MAVEITVILDGSPGSMARVVAALKRFGLTFAGHHIESLNENHSRLTVNAGGRAAAGELRNGLSGVKGVVEVVGVESYGGSAPAGRRTAAPVEVTGSEDLVHHIVNNYPKILWHIDAYEESVSSRNRARQLRRLGKQVGSRLGEQAENLEAARTLHEALEGSVVPILNGIADPEVVGSDIRIRLSIFTRGEVNTTDPVLGGEPSRCAFLSGMIEGMIACVSALPGIHVEETSCRTNGAEYCLFRISS